MGGYNSPSTSTNPVSAIVIDTSVWVEYFRGVELPLVDQALQDGTVLLPVVVAAELLSGTHRTVEAAELRDFLECLRPHGLDITHWYRVGALRSILARKGVQVSTPDAHIAQCALDLRALLYTHDRIFSHIARLTALRLSPTTP